MSSQTFSEMCEESAVRLYLQQSDIDEDFLAHYGIKGMKWGIRRFQNPDGTLTAAGKERYSNTKTIRKLGMDPKGLSSSISNNGTVRIADKAYDLADATYFDKRSQILTPKDTDSDSVKKAKKSIDDSGDTYLNPPKEKGPDGHLTYSSDSQARQSVSKEYCDKWWKLADKYGSDDDIPISEAKNLWNSSRVAYAKALLKDLGVDKPDSASVKELVNVYKQLENLESDISKVFTAISYASYANGV